jgi:hypothetical protein
MTIPHSHRVCRSSAVSAQCRDLFADRLSCRRARAVLTPSAPFLFTKRARRAGRPSNFGANRMHRASRLCSSRIVVSAAQSPKVEWLLRALRLKAFPTQSRPVEHSAPPCSSDFVTEMRLRGSSLMCDLALHVGLLKSSRIKFEPSYLYCSGFAGGALCMPEFPVVFECSRGSYSKAVRACRQKHILAVYRIRAYKRPSR